MTGRHQGLKRKLWAGYRALSQYPRPMCHQSYFCLLHIGVHCNAWHSFQCRVWYRILSLCYACIRHCGIILTPEATLVPNSVSVAPSVAELAHGRVRGNIRTPSIARWKALLDFLFAIIEFARYRLQLRCYKQQSVEIGVFQRGVTSRLDFIFKGYFSHQHRGPLDRKMAVLQLCRWKFSHKEML